MSTTPNHNASGVSGIPAATQGTPGSTSSHSPPLTFKAVIGDVASWWCYAILRKGDLKLFDELDDILDSLPGPFPASSSLSIRLRCLVPWHELLKQLYTPGCTVGEKQFETIQDKLLLLHQGFFSKTSTAEEFNDVLRMVQTHSVLSKLYSYFSKSDDAQNEQQNATNKVLDQCNAEWESIYLESNGVPPSLLDLVDKNNGWDFEDRKDHIIQIVSFPESALTYKRLKKKMQSLLLHWFENEIIDSNEAGTKVPELLEKRYRGIGYGNDDSVPKNATGSIETIPKTPADSKVDPDRLGEEKSNGVASPSAPQQQPQQQDKKDEEEAGLILDSSDSDDWSDFDPEEELRRLKLHRERQKKFRSSNEWEVEEMPVGEPSYSLPERKSFRGRNRGRRNDRDYRHRSTNIPSCSQPSSGRKRARQRRRRKLKARDPPRIRIPNAATQHFWDSDDSSSSSSFFDENDDEATLWTQEEDDALKNGIQCNGYGNWTEILKEEKQLLGSKEEEDLRERANILLGQR